MMLVEVRFWSLYYFDFMVRYPVSLFVSSCAFTRNSERAFHSVAVCRKWKSAR